LSDNEDMIKELEGRIASSKKPEDEEEAADRLREIKRGERREAKAFHDLRVARAEIELRQEDIERRDVALAEAARELEESEAARSQLEQRVSALEKKKEELDRGVSHLQARVRAQQSALDEKKKSSLFFKRWEVTPREFLVLLRYALYHLGRGGIHEYQGEKPDLDGIDAEEVEEELKGFPASLHKPTMAELAFEPHRQRGIPPRLRREEEGEE
jgi:hypothetical protein